MFAVHVRGAFLMTRAVLRPCLPRNAGVGRLHGWPNLGRFGRRRACHYSAAKARIIGLTKSLAARSKRTGRSVNAVAPGADQYGRLFEALADGRKAKAAELPLGRFASQRSRGGDCLSVFGSQGLFVGQTSGPIPEM